MLRRTLVGCVLAFLAAGCITPGDVAGEAVDKAVEVQGTKADKKDAWCPDCGSEAIKLTKWGKIGVLVGGLRHRFKCKKCGKEFD